MAKQQAGTHQPLGWRDKLRLNAAIRHLRSPFRAVRVAAHNEIRAILRGARTVRGRMRAWAQNAGRAAARKVTPKRMHGALGVEARGPKAPKRGPATPIAPRMPAGGFRPLTDHPLTRADMKQRERDAKAAARPPREDRKWGGLRKRLADAPAAPSRAAPGKPAPEQQRLRDGRQPDVLAAAGLTRPQAKAPEPQQFRKPLDVVAAPERNGNAPRTERAAPAVHPLPSQTLRPVPMPRARKPLLRRLRPSRSR